ncbi:MAG: type II toxin-antitoxin system RelE/ParE family toxin [Patescibacteria group bacterium]
MSWKWVIDSKAAKELKKLPAEAGLRIVEKLDFWCEAGMPIRFAERLKEFELGQYRFRVGDYRITFDVEDEVIIVLAVGHRKEIYR